MSDNAPQAQVVVNGSPTAVQIEAAIRDGIKILGAVAGALGAAKVAGGLDQVLLIAGPLATVVAFIWGQFATRTKATDAITMAKALPDAVATVK